jgi:hypothetical protein
VREQGSKDAALSSGGQKSAPKTVVLTAIPIAAIVLPWDAPKEAAAAIKRSSDSSRHKQGPHASTRTLHFNNDDESDPLRLPPPYPPLSLNRHCSRLLSNGQSDLPGPRSFCRCSDRALLCIEGAL